MKETLKLTFILTIICLIAGALLAGVDILTREPITQVKQKLHQKSLDEVLPPHDNSPVSDSVNVTHGGQDWTFYIARNQGQFAGAAVETVSPDGYSGEVRLMFGIGADGKSIGISILAQKETPGLGANIDTPGFKNRFVGLDLQKTNWKVKKDGGDIDHITAATISSRAVVDAISNALEAFNAHRQTIENGK